MSAKRHVSSAALRAVGVVAVFGALVGAVPSARASLMRPFDLATLSDEAHLIAVGEVTATESRWNEARDRIFTFADVRLTAVVKGDPATAVVTIKQPGGEVDGVVMHVAGTADLTLGATAVLFLRTDGIFHYLVAMGEGAFPVWTVPADAAGVWAAHRGQQVIGRTPPVALAPSRAVAVAGAGPAARPVVGRHAAPAPTPLPLADFLSKVRTLVVPDGVRPAAAVPPVVR